MRLGWPYLWSTLGVVLATLAGLGLTSFVQLPNVSMVFLLTVLFSAARFGIWPALFASGLSFLAYNFFFIQPLHTFSVTQPHELLALFVLLVVAILTSTIAGRARDQARRAVERDLASRRLYDFASRLSALADPQSVLDGAAVQAYGDLKHPSIILLPDGTGLKVSAACPLLGDLDAAALSAAKAALAEDGATGAGTATCSDVPWLFLPLRTPDGPAGVIGVAQSAQAPLGPEARTLFQTLAELTATALERARLGQEITAARTAAETERVRNTLLASISHDFRTPLASILGAATSLIEYGSKLPDLVRHDLLSQVKDEAEHLDGMVRNLLSMTRVEAGALELRRDWIDVSETLNRVVALAKRRGARQAFEVLVEPSLPYVYADPNLIDQALGNIVGNALRYAGRTALVALSAKGQRDGFVAIEVVDDGPGIAPEVLPHVFQRFARGRDGTGADGTGLGLAIAKGIVEAHGGTISAQSPVENGRGTRITLRLPAGEEAHG